MKHMWKSCTKSITIGLVGLNPPHLILNTKKILFILIYIILPLFYLGSWDVLVYTHEEEIISLKSEIDSILLR